MDSLLTVIQIVSGVILTLIHLLPHTYDPDKKTLTKLGWVLLLIAFIGLVGAGCIKDVKNTDREKRLYQRIDDLTESLATIVMKSPREAYEAPAPKPTTELEIRAPKNKAQVQARTYVEGRISNARSKVWVIIHPMETSSYWVQQSITVHEDGTWKVAAYFGRSGEIDVGKQFEIMAVANPKVLLKEGKVLDGWPAAQWSSQAIEVTRS